MANSRKTRKTIRSEAPIDDRRKWLVQRMNSETRNNVDVRAHWIHIMHAVSVFRLLNMSTWECCLLLHLLALGWYGFTSFDRVR